MARLSASLESRRGFSSKKPTFSHSVADKSFEPVYSLVDVFVGAAMAWVVEWPSTTSLSPGVTVGI